ncbi:MAG: hypothetical protein ABI612_19595 [Betaproteobacteria bacterium]
MSYRQLTLYERFAIYQLHVPVMNLEPSVRWHGNEDGWKTKAFQESE